MGLFVQLVRHDRTGELYIVFRDTALKSYGFENNDLDVAPWEWRPCVLTLRKGAELARGEKFTVLRNVHLQHADD